MKGDFSRNSFDPAKRYTGVRLQQGRVQLDADWNEQVDITAERQRSSLRDLVGAAGGPLPTPGFEVVADPALPAGDVRILPGRYYVDGVVVENPAPTTLISQPEGGGTALPDGRHLLYLDVWEQHLTFVEDERIREVALGGPDTATRTRQVWQVRSLPVGDGFHCLASDPGWDALVAGSSGRMAAQAEPPAAAVDPCVVPASAGFRGLQNRLYRVEIHGGGTLATATMKWSRDNGTVLFPVEEVNVDGSATRLRLRSLGRDDELSLKVGDHVEVLDDDNELSGSAGLLTQVSAIDADDRIVTLAAAVAGIDPLRHAKLRRWDSAGALKVGPKGWIALEDGLEVRFETGSYRSGDHWLIPARTILGNPLLVAGKGLDWPRLGADPVALPPEGIRHRYARLAIVRRTGGTTTREHDCRRPFPALTELRHLHYVSGDGQEGMPDLTAAPTTAVPLAEPLRVGVANGSWAVAGARVRFRLSPTVPGARLVVPAGAIVDPQLSGSDQERTLLTAADGTASCRWELAGNRAIPVQGVEATLLDAAGNAQALPVLFHANLSVAERVAFDPGACGSLAGARHVQEAIRRLASLAQLHYVGGDGQEAAPGTRMALPLQVRVASSCGPILGAQVRFETSKGGQLAEKATTLDKSGGKNSLTITTDDTGLAKAYWLPDPKLEGAQTVRAVLVGGPEPLGAFTAVEFHGRLARTRGAERGIAIQRILIGPNREDLVLDGVVTPAVLLGGLEIVTSEPIEVSSLRGNGPQQPVLSVALGLPYPLTDADQRFWADTRLMGRFGFTNLELAAEVTVDNSSLYWTPSPEVGSWLQQVLFQRLRQSRHDVERLLVRLSLRGNFLLGETSRQLHLDGEGFRSLDTPGYSLPSGDGHRGGTLDLWFWLQEGPRD